MTRHFSRVASESTLKGSLRGNEIRGLTLDLPLTRWLLLIPFIFSSEFFGVSPERPPVPAVTAALFCYRVVQTQSIHQQNTATHRCDISEVGCNESQLDVMNHNWNVFSSQKNKKFKLLFLNIMFVHHFPQFYNSDTLTQNTVQ